MHRHHVGPVRPGPASSGRPEIEPPVCSTVFVDRDGVINVNRPDHVKSWAEFEFLPGAIAGLALLAGHGRRVIVLTNQAAVNRGLMTGPQLNLIHARMVAEVAAHGGEIAAVIACPHRPEEACGCRKPAPGLLLSAAARCRARLDDAVLIGDHANDLEAARRAGCRSVLVLSGRTEGWASERLPDGCLAVLPDLLAAARWITGERPASAATQVLQTGIIPEVLS